MNNHQHYNSLEELVEKARAKQLQPHEYNSGTFTLSNLGMFGVDQFDAILPPGQVREWVQLTSVSNTIHIFLGNSLNLKLNDVQGAIMAVGASKPTRRPARWYDQKQLWRMGFVGRRELKELKQENGILSQPLHVLKKIPVVESETSSAIWKFWKGAIMPFHLLIFLKNLYLAGLRELNGWFPGLRLTTSLVLPRRPGDNGTGPSAPHHQIKRIMNIISYSSLNSPLLPPSVLLAKINHDSSRIILSKYAR
ncbi:hypothetical protein RND71_023202 [Anisodus tanguticus]|uniref:2-oxoacid dehydrogenase acyltransferase catalytic domain-containing protein n=1 Tax=Anisodus tanguticus TaxID=243964 RepID=A0AAE1V6R3_9SOLA|nr:hypothetical protein RND71_023202 [Anisodus tanguticus]